jgi:hypothetical protein
MPAGVLAKAFEASWDDPCVVEDELVASSEIFPKIAHQPVLNSITLQVNHHHPRLIARLGGTSRDQFGVKVEVELIGTETHPVLHRILPVGLPPLPYPRFDLS